MIEETPKCYKCILKLQGNPMVEIGGIGKTTQIVRAVGSKDNLEVVGTRELKLYQCPECKDVKID